MNSVKKAVIIPSYKVADSIRDVVVSIPATIDHIIVVDDKCPQGSGNIAKEIADDRIIVIYHEQNQGVGAAVLSGYKKAMELAESFAIEKVSYEMVKSLIDRNLLTVK